MATNSEIEMPKGIYTGTVSPQGIRSALPKSVFVLFTSTYRTLNALETACKLVKPSGGRVVVVATPVVPYPLPIDEPQVPSDFAIGNFVKLAERIPGRISIITYRCRDRMDALKRVLRPNAQIVIGIRKIWWPTRDRRLARKLRRAGYPMTVIETE